MRGICEMNAYVELYIAFPHFSLAGKSLWYLQQIISVSSSGAGLFVCRTKVNTLQRRECYEGQKVSQNCQDSR